MVVRPHDTQYNDKKKGGRVGMQGGEERTRDRSWAIRGASVRVALIWVFLISRRLGEPEFRFAPAPSCGGSFESSW